MTPIRWTPLAATAVATMLALAPAAPARPGEARRSDLCVIVDPVLELGCGSPAGSPPAGGARATAQDVSDTEDSGPVRMSSTAVRYDPDRLAVTFVRGTSAQTARAVVARAGATIERAVPKIRAYLLGVDPDRRAEALRSLGSSSAVASASQEQLVEAFDTSPDDSDWPQQQGLRVVGFPKAWDVTRGSSRVVVAVIDTGVDARQPDLGGALVPGYDFVNSDSDPADDVGHGTAVAGIIAARANNHEGAAGICWRCSVMPIKALDSTGSGDDTTIAAGIVWAVDHGARVINLSLGGPGASQQLTDAIGYAVRKNAIVVAAAGNSGTTTPFFPAGDPRVLSVAATTVADRRYSWSNFGSWVSVAAPGCNVAPLLGGYGPFCGTSSAAPLVTGLVALELSVAPGADAEQIHSALVRAVVPLPGVVQYGRIDAGRTFALLHPAPEAARATTVFHGTLGPRAATRTYRIVAAAGNVTARLRFTGASRLALSLIPVESSVAIARVAGPSPLQLQTPVGGGTFVLRVTGPARTKTTFELNVSYASKRS